jgi:hypothetical protein
MLMFVDVFTDDIVKRFSAKFRPIAEGGRRRRCADERTVRCS